MHADDHMLADQVADQVHIKRGVRLRVMVKAYLKSMRMCLLVYSPPPPPPPTPTVESLLSAPRDENEFGSE